MCRAEAETSTALALATAALAALTTGVPGVGSGGPVAWFSGASGPSWCRGSGIEGISIITVYGNTA